VAFADLQAIANTALFSGAGFGEPVTYTPEGGAPVVVQGIYWKREVEVPIGDSSVGAFEHRVDVRAADISGGPRRGATVTVRGTPYGVTDIHGPDDAGVSSLMLELPEA
jgi:hypothetical protein